jgi:hypothetical protein
MLWLFGQIWLWLLIAFLLGAAVMWLLMRAARPKPVAERETYEHDEADEEPLEVPAPLEAERTQYIPVGQYDHDESPERVYNDYPEVDPDEPYVPEDHAEGRLPEPEARLSGDLGWPATAETDAETTGEWLRTDQPSPRQPGRGG